MFGVLTPYETSDLKVLSPCVCCPDLCFLDVGGPGTQDPLLLAHVVPIVDGAVLP